MLTILFIWLYLLFLSTIYGSAYLVLSPPPSSSQDSIPLSFINIVGVNLLMAILAIWSIFAPINWWTHLFIGVIALLLLVVRPKRWKVYWKDRLQQHQGNIYYYLGSLLWLALLLVQSTKIPFWTDVAGYHAQAIQWIEHYAVVPGLTNLHSRYGFNPHAHLLAAFGNMRFLGWGPIYSAFSSFLLLLMGVFLVRQTVYASISKRLVAISTLAFLLLFYRDWVSSPNPDIFCTVFVLFIGYAFYYAKQLPVFLNQPYVFYALIFLMFNLITTKLSAFTILFFLPCLFYYRQKALHPITLGKITLLWMLVFLPFFIRNYYLSGYLVYPFEVVDLFQVDWKVPTWILEEEAAAVKNFAKMASYDRAYVESLSFYQWFPHWLNRRAFFEYPLLLLLILNPIISFVLYLKAKNKKQFFSQSWLSILSFFCCLVWFILAPYFRFAHGFILMAALLPLPLVIENWRNQWVQGLAQLMTQLSIGITILLISYSLYRECKELSTASFNYWMTLEEMPPPDVKTTTVNGRPIAVAQNEYLFCWDHPLPCTPKLLPQLQLRGQQLQTGFLLKDSLKDNK